MEITVSSNWSDKIKEFTIEKHNVGSQGDGNGNGNALHLAPRECVPGLFPQLWRKMPVRTNIDLKRRRG